MHTKLKLSAAAACLLMAVAAFAGSASASASDSVSRTFPTLDGALRYEAKNGGIGIYDPADPSNVCLVSLLGVQSPTSSFYYDALRIRTNMNKQVAEITGLGVVGPPFDCPDILEFVPKGADKQVVIDDANLFLGPHILMDTILCSQKAANSSCFPTPGLVNWDVYACNTTKPGTGFTWLDDDKNLATGLIDDVIDLVEDVDAGVAAILRSTLGSLPILSRSITCDSARHAHDVSEKVNNDGDNFGQDFVSSGFDGPTVGVVVHAGDGDGYVVSCVTVPVTQVRFGGPTDPPGTVYTTMANATSHDWFLTLDRSTPTTWAASILNHLGLDTLPALTHPLKGLYDLGGKNGCPFADTGCGQEDKKPGGPLGKPGEGCDAVGGTTKL